jgi:hypothetical protein
MPEETPVANSSPGAHSPFRIVAIPDHPRCVVSEQ